MVKVFLELRACVLNLMFASSNGGVIHQTWPTLDGNWGGGIVGHIFRIFFKQKYISTTWKIENGIFGHKSYKLPPTHRLPCRPSYKYARIIVKYGVGMAMSLDIWLIIF